MSDRHPKLLLEDILDSAQKIISYTNNLSFDDFIADSKTIDAVTRNFEIIGEAANRLPHEIKETNTGQTGLRYEVCEIESFTIILELIIR